MKFNSQYGEHYETTSFNTPKEEINVTIDGQTVNMWDRIQAANVDVDVYETLEKYHMAPTLANCEDIFEQKPMLYQDLSKIMEFEHPQDAINYATEQWNMLPINVRKEFGNDINKFIKNGESWAKEKGKAYIEKYLAEQKEKEQPKSEVTNNEQKQ